MKKSIDNKTPKALLVGSSFSAVPIFFALKNHGIHVSVCGNVKSDPCHQYADASIYIDYSSPDELMREVEKGNFDYLVPTCNDYSYMSCALVAEKHGFPGFDRYDLASIIHTKSKFRQVTEKYSLPVPKFVKHRIGQVINTEKLCFPLLVKPVDSFSGRGISKIMNSEELPLAVQDAFQASRSGELVLEECVDGTLHSHSAFIENQNIVLDFFVDEFCATYPYQVNCSNHPSALSLGMKEVVREVIQQMVSVLQLNDGLLHTQIIVNGSKFWIIECMRRCPGDLYGSLISFSTGIEYAGLFIRPFLNMKLPSITKRNTVKYFGRHTISIMEPLIYFSFSQHIPAEAVEIVALKESGAILNVAPFDKLAILFAEFKDRETMFDITSRMADFVNIQSYGDSIRAGE